MPSGGVRRGAGRKKGSATKRTREIADRAAAEGITPLEFMLKIMRNEACPEDADISQRIAFHAMRFEAAKAAAPYVHPRLGAIEHSGEITHNYVAEVPAVAGNSDDWRQQHTPPARLNS